MITCTGGGFLPPFLTTIAGHATLFYRIHEVLDGRASDKFLSRIVGIFADRGADKLTAAQVIEKGRKVVTWFIDENLAE